MARARVTGLALAGLGLAATLAAIAIGEGRDAASWGPRTMPLLAAAALLVAGLADALSGDDATPGDDATSGERVASDRTSIVADVTSTTPGDGRRLAWALLGVAVLYALLMSRTGYLVSTSIAAVAAFALFGARRPAALVAAAVLCPIALHLVFFVFLGAFPPRGAWFDALDWLPS